MNIELDFFTTLVNEHESTFTSCASFFKTNDELVQSYVDLDYSSNYEDAQERFDNFNISSLMIDNRWHMDYELVDSIWVFRRALGFNELQKQQYNDNLILRSMLGKKVSLLSPSQFEELILEIFQQIECYQIPIERPFSKDGGIEFSIQYLDPITNSSDRIYIQVKKENKSLCVNHTRSLIGVLDIASRKNRNNRVRGIMVSLLPPSPESIDAAMNSYQSIDFISLDRILDLMIEYGIGC